MQPAWKNSNSNKKYCHHSKKEKITISFLKKHPPQNSPPLNVYYMECYSNFSLNIVKLAL